MRNLGDNHLKPKIPTAERRTYPAGYQHKKHFLL
jgi:hypothetical protein